MINLRELIDACKAEAISSKFLPTESADWRWFCREYSKTFHTPLHEVLLLPPELVVLAVFEEQIDQYKLDEEKDFTAIIEQVRRLEDPDYDENQDKALDEFVAGVEQWEEQRQADKRPIPVPKKSIFRNPKPEPVKEDPRDQAIPKELPKEGFINLSYLSKEEEES